VPASKGTPTRPDADDNGGVDESPWSRLKSETYALVGRNPKSNRLLPTIADLDASHAVLDIGCGPGVAVRAAAPSVARAVGVDRSAAMIDIARRRSRRYGNVEFTVAGAEALPFPDEAFDRVWTIHSFHHWEVPGRGLAEALRVSSAGARPLIVENETGGSHGLDEARALRLAEELRAVGFAEIHVSRPYRQLVVTAVRGS
jgi:ubiquinone/menaquinone biosynthesis C-methylase UbiE